MRIYRVENDEGQGPGSNPDVNLSKYTSWGVDSHPPIQDVLPEFNHGMKVGCQSFEDLERWFSPCVYTREMFDVHGLMVTVYEVPDESVRIPEETKGVAGQIAYYPKKAVLVEKLDFLAYYDAYVEEVFGEELMIRKQERRERRQKQKEAA